MIDKIKTGSNVLTELYGISCVIQSESVIFYVQKFRFGRQGQPAR